MILQEYTKLQYPLSNFWVSEPYSPQHGLGISTYCESHKNYPVQSAGDGEVVKIDILPKGQRVWTKHPYRHKAVYISIYPMTALTVVVGQNVTQNEVMGEMAAEHLHIHLIEAPAADHLTFTEEHYKMNPLSRLYVYPRQINPYNVPGCLPRYLPPIKSNKER